MQSGKPNNKAVAFTGHRTFKISVEPTLFGGEDADLFPDTIKPRLMQVIDTLYNEGYRTFLCGMAEGFDLLAAEVVACLMSLHNDVRLVAVIPHPGQSSRFGHDAAEQYLRLLEAATDKIMMSEKYAPNCFHKRNDYLIDNSDVLVCFYNGTKGGTAYTVKRARSAGHRIINVNKKSRSI